VDIEPDGITDYEGTYEEYVAFSGDDRLDAEKVVLKAKTEKKGKKIVAPAASGSQAKPRAESSPNRAMREKKVAQDRHAELMHLIEAAEGRIAEIDAFFAQGDSYRTTPQDDIRRLETERSGLATEVAALMEEWERAEEEVRALR